LEANLRSPWFIQEAARAGAWRREADHGLVGGPGAVIHRSLGYEPSGSQGGELQRLRCAGRSSNYHRAAAGWKPTASLDGATTAPLVEALLIAWLAQARGRPCFTGHDS